MSSDEREIADKPNSDNESTMSKNDNDDDNNNNDVEDDAPVKEEQEEEVVEEEVEPEPPIDPATVALPWPSSEEQTFHADTLLAEEDEEVPVLFPSSFASKYLRTPDSSISPSDAAQLGTSKATFHLPGSLSLEAASVFRDALSPTVQAASVSSPHTPEKKRVYVGAKYTYDPDEPRKESLPSSSIPTLLSRLDYERPMNTEPFVTLFCPYEHASEVLDAVVHDVAQRESCDVVTLDSLELARGRDGAFGEGILLSPPLSVALCR
ncbi:hypothetical protein DL93DRAFT_1101414 [Clavulina sp. PMI_390]|nr:hypothetical protein DL93DRAFT_1101414 [Clavulina sp. PMI_390]